MSTLNILWLVAMTAVFLVWAFFMFRMLWRLTRRSLGRYEKTGGGYFRWAGHSLSSFGEFATSGADRKERRRLLLLTALLFAIIIARPILLAGG